jgi:HPt (histidine-containing phosphotransfer) domain-containing protein
LQKSGDLAYAHHFFDFQATFTICSCIKRNLTPGVNKEFPAMRRGMAAAQNLAAGGAASLCTETVAFDAAEFDELSEAIGADGALEMVEIFETETRKRLRRLAMGDQDIATQRREIHTLKGAAGTVSAPRLAALGQMFEQAANRGIGPVPEEIEALDEALEACLTEMRAWSRRRRAEG